MNNRRVVIVGAGVLGLFTAWELAQAGGCDITVLDRAHPGNGSSGRSIGMVETQHLTAPDVEVRVHGLEVYQRLEREHGISFVHGGYLRLSRSDADVDAFEKSARLQGELGVTGTLVLGEREIAGRWPHLMTDDLVVGLFGRSDGHVDGYEVCQVLAGLVRHAGVTVLSGTSLIEAGQTSAGTWQVRTDGPVLEADVMVNAAGAWAAQVGDLLHAPINLEPLLSGAVTISSPKPVPPTPFVMDYVPGSGTEGVYFRPEGTHQLFAGVHTDESVMTPESPDRRLGPLSPDVIEHIVTMLGHRLRDVEDLGIGKSWTGWYPFTHDHHPVVGPHVAAPTVICALGAGGAGIQLAPAIGRLAANAVLGEAPTLGHGLDWSHGR